MSSPNCNFAQRTKPALLQRTADDTAKPSNVVSSLLPIRNSSQGNDGSSVSRPTSPQSSIIAGSPAGSSSQRRDSTQGKEEGRDLHMPSRRDSAEIDEREDRSVTRNSPRPNSEPNSIEDFCMDTILL
ncbi:hypothetical protein O0L34_g313 [Tuta absoluta]|nr:hypothetical protein O0L34_g313 [Tuta absoluta]